MTNKWLAPKVSRRGLLIAVPGIAIGLGNAKLFAAAG